MQMRDALGTLFTDDQFTDLDPADGQPGYAPWRLALVSVMQFAENLTDRQAANAVCSRIDWKYALSLELTDEGFDFSVLSEFRQRLLTHDASTQLLDQMLRQFQDMGLLNWNSPDKIWKNSGGVGTRPRVESWIVTSVEETVPDQCERQQLGTAPGEA